MFQLQIKPARFFVHDFGIFKPVYGRFKSGQTVAPATPATPATMTDRWNEFKQTTLGKSPWPRFLQTLALNDLNRLSEEMKSWKISGGALQNMKRSLQTAMQTKSTPTPKMTTPTTPTTPAAPAPPAPTEPVATATPAAPSNPKPQDPRQSLTRSQISGFLRDPASARKALEVYRQMDPAYANRLEKTLKHWGLTDADLSPQTASQAPTPAPVQQQPPQAAQFQTPTWAAPNVQQRMQEMYELNQRNKQFDEWAATAQQHGFTPEQINELKKQITSRPIPQQYRTQQQTQTQQQQPSFWKDVGQNAAVGGAAGLFSGGLPGAAIGTGIGGGVGAVKNVWNRGKNLWNQFDQFRKQRQPITPYAGSARSIMKESSTENEIMQFLDFVERHDPEFVGAFVHLMPK